MIAVEQGFPSGDKPIATALFWEAFKGKLGFCLGPKAKAHSFLEEVMAPIFSFSAYDGDRLVGLVGYKTSEGGLIGGEYQDLARVYGYFGAAWRGVILSMFERELNKGQLLLDGIFVAADARGRGVGTALLDEIEAYARFELYDEIRLDVIDTNPRARALYERRGYVEAGTVKTSFLQPLLGFSKATTMIKTL